MDSIEIALRARAKNNPGADRAVLHDLLLSQGREDSMPFLLEDWMWERRRTLRSGGSPYLTLWNGWVVTLMPHVGSDAWFYDARVPGAVYEQYEYGDGVPAEKVLEALRKYADEPIYAGATEPLTPIHREVLRLRIHARRFQALRPDIMAPDDEGDLGEVFSGRRGEGWGVQFDITDSDLRRELIQG